MIQALKMPLPKCVYKLNLNRKKIDNYHTLSHTQDEQIKNNNNHLKRFQLYHNLTPQKKNNCPET